MFGDSASICMIPEGCGPSATSQLFQPSQLLCPDISQLPPSYIPSGSHIEYDGCGFWSIVPNVPGVTYPTPPQMASVGQPLTIKQQTQLTPLEPLQPLPVPISTSPVLTPAPTPSVLAPSVLVPSALAPSMFTTENILVAGLIAIILLRK